MSLLESRLRYGIGFTVATFLSLIIGGCSSSNDSSRDTTPETPVIAEDVVRMNQLQYLGSHNSYHIQAKADLFELLLAYIPDIAPTLAYTHLPLAEQFGAHGIRQIELDIFHDPEGGLYANHQARSLFSEEVASGIAELDQPGLKVLHVQEIDYETHCYTFVSCLQQVKQWSDNNPDHLPIMILVEVKDEVIDDPLDLGFTIPLKVNIDVLNTVDLEVRSVFADTQLILPDDVRGDFETLEEAVLEQGWLPVSEARGRIMFSLNNGGSDRASYIEGHPSLDGRVMFTNSPAGTPEAAFMMRNDPLPDDSDISSLVGLGYMVRTRADADTQQSRNGDTTRRDAALESGAQFISTDYYVPNLDFSDYQVTIPGGGVARCNPISATDICSTDSF